MRTVLTPHRTEVGFWLLLWVGLAVGIGLETDWGRQLEKQLPIIVAPPADFSPPRLTEPFRLPPPDHFLGITERPIFVATRRPPPIPLPAEPPKPSMKKGQFALLGTMIVPDGKFAILLEKSGNKSRTVPEGKEINGITVKSVTPDRVVLSQNDDTEVLVLKTAVAPKAATAPVPASSPAATPGTRPITGRRQPALPPVGAAGEAPPSISPSQ